MRGMVINMEETKLQTLEQIKAFLDGTSDVVPQFAVDDGYMLGWVPLLFMSQLPKAGSIAEHLADHALVDRLAFPDLAVLRGPGL